MPSESSVKSLPLHPNGHLGLARAGEPVTVLRSRGEEHVLGLRYGCAVCDEAPELRVTAAAVEVLNACPYPEGITTEIVLAVPSGRIIVTDNLRHVYDWDDEAIGDYNTAIGQARAIRAMADAGCAYGPVGNSCPGFYRTGPDSYIIARGGYDEDSGDRTSPATGAKQLASICTDLWAYSLADLAHFTSLGGSITELGGNADIVDVTPGAYRFTHHTGEATFDHDTAQPLIFAHVERIA